MPIGFFEKTPVEPGVEKTLSRGGLGQFHALAITLLDCYKHRPQTSSVPLKRILDRLFTYYPTFISMEPSRNLVERMLMLTNTPRGPEIIECMAYVLRQLAVDEIYERPLNYREAFEGLSAETSKGYMRQSSTLLPASALGAVAHTLGLKLTLSITEPFKPLRQCNLYDFRPKGVQSPELVVQVQGGTYFPEVKDEGAFTPVSQVANGVVAQIESMPEHFGTLAALIRDIEEDNHRLLVSYSQIRKTLMYMIERDELSRNELRDLYIKFLPTRDYFYTSSLDRLLNQEQQDKKPMSFEAPLKTGERVNAQLIDLVSGLISIGHINSDAFFNELETNHSRSAVKSLLGASIHR
ncbi:MAG: hypothetical protein ACHP6H_01020 [Legionellales bacterium]